MNRSEFSSGARRIINCLEACFPKNSVCLHLRGDKPRGTSAQVVRHQSFELRHDSNDEKVTIGWHGLRKAPTTRAAKPDRSLSTHLRDARRSRELRRVFA